MARECYICGKSDGLRSLPHGGNACGRCIRVHELHVSEKIEAAQPETITGHIVDPPEPLRMRGPYIARSSLGYFDREGQE